MTSLRIGGHVDQDRPDRRGEGARGHLVAVLPRRPAGLEGPGHPVRRRRGGAAGRRRGGGHRPLRARALPAQRRLDQQPDPHPARKLLQQHAHRRAEIGAKGVIVHGGHVLKDDDPDDGLRQLAQVRRRARPAGAAADREHRRRRQRDGPPARRGSPGCGTRSARPRAATRSGSASTPATPTPAARSWPPSSSGSRAITGRIDLVHANDSRDDVRLRRRPARQLRRRPDRRRRPRRRWSGAAGAPVVCETPGGADGQGADIAWLRERVDLRRLPLASAAACGLAARRPVALRRVSQIVVRTISAADHLAFLRSRAERELPADAGLG